MISYPVCPLYDGHCYGRIVRKDKAESFPQGSGCVSVKSAIDDVKSDLQDEIREASDAGNKALCDILSSMLLVFEDDDLAQRINSETVDSGGDAALGVCCFFDRMAEMFTGQQDDFFRQKAEDMEDIKNRLLSKLSREDSGISDNHEGHTGCAALSSDAEDAAKEPITDEPLIYVGDRLTVSAFLRLRRNKVTGFILRECSLMSHVAIAAANMDVFLGVCNYVPEAADYEFVIYDSRNGKLEFTNDYISYCDAKKKAIATECIRTEADSYADLSIPVYANVSDAASAQQAIDSGFAGIGLFRSEFVFLERDEYPSANEQKNIYRQVFEASSGNLCIIRTMDFAKDKWADYLGDRGLYGLDWCLENEDRFREQLTAIRDCAKESKPEVLIPMVRSISQMERVLAIFDSLNMNKPRIMIENPEAVDCCEQLAKMVSGFSVGTNDLITGLFGYNRESLYFAQLTHDEEDILEKAIRKLVRAAHTNHIPIGVCGELASLPVWQKRLEECGVDYLSVAPRKK